MPRKSGNTRTARAKARARGVTPQAKQKSKRATVKVIPDVIIEPKRLSSVWQLTSIAAQTIWQYRKLFFGIALTYGVLNLLLVQGLAGNANITNLKHSLDQAFQGHGSQLASSLASLVLLVGSAGGQSSSSQAAGVFQLFLILMTTLAIIWALRQVLAGASVRIRDSFYLGMYPFVPFILILLVIGLQLLPLVIGSALYATAISGGIAINWLEDLFWLAIFAGLAAWSLYLVCSSIFAAYIVTLPDMTPLKALRSARELVKSRRWIVLRKLLYLPVALTIASSIIMLPIIVWLTPLSQAVFFLLSLAGLLLIHSYLYNLYRELLA